MLARSIAWGCSAHAQVALHLARSCGIPAILVKSLDWRWLEHDNQSDGRGTGHVYVEVIVDGKVRLWDAQGGVLHTNYDPECSEFENRLIYEKGSPEELVLAHHGPEWEAETARRFPARISRGRPR